MNQHLTDDELATIAKFATARIDVLTRAVALPIPELPEGHVRIYRALNRSLGRDPYHRPDLADFAHALKEYAR